MLERQSNQGGADWLRERAGHASASCCADILAVGRNGLPLKAREDYLMRLVVERITRRCTARCGIGPGVGRFLFVRSSHADGRLKLYRQWIYRDEAYIANLSRAVSGTVTSGPVPAGDVTARCY